MNKKIIAIILSSTVVLGALGFLIYTEGNNSNVVNAPIIPTVQAPSITPKPQEEVAPEVTEEDKDSTNKEETDKDKGKTEEDKELEYVYNRVDAYNEENTIDVMQYASNSILELEERLVAHINTTNSNTNANISQAIKDNTTATDSKLTALAEKVKAAEEAAKQAALKAQAAADKLKEEAQKPTQQTPATGTKDATITGLGIKGTFTGDVVSGAPNGKGDFTKYSADKKVEWTFSGEFKNGQIGTGVISYPDNTVVESTFTGGVANGASVFTTPSFKYEGTMENGFMTGSGVITYANGDSYTGTFKNNNYDGLGIYKDSTDKILLQGYFKNGIFIERMELNE